jgi:hypothetical protein
MKLILWHKFYLAIEFINIKISRINKNKLTGDNSRIYKYLLRDKMGVSGAEYITTIDSNRYFTSRLEAPTGDCH